MPRHARLAALLLLVPLLSGCIGTDPGEDAVVDPARADGVSIRLTEPVELTGEEGGFEPSIAVGPNGTVYVTAAPTSRPAAGDQLSSWLWYAEDDGAGFDEVPSPANVHEAFPGFEGDVAVDAEGRLYFVDINLGDTIFHRWAPGPSWESSRPLATSIPVDDRPWLAAHGDGVVYLLLNDGEPLPAPENLLEGDATPGDKWLFVSEDAGRTWTLGRQISQGEDWCQIDASPDDDRTLLLVCQPGFSAEGEATVRLSTDRGAAVEDVHSLDLTHGPGFLVPGAAIDPGGSLYGAYVDERVEASQTQAWTWAGEEPGRLRYTVSTDGGQTFSDHDVTPFEARFSTLDASAGRSGTLALTFYATQDLAPDEETEWYPYLMVSANATAEDPSWTTVRLLDEPSGTGPTPPFDFFQNAIGPDNAVHVVLQRNIPHDPVRDGVVSGIPADVLYVRQTSGPNLGG